MAIMWLTLGVQSCYQRYFCVIALIRHVMDESHDLTRKEGEQEVYNSISINELHRQRSTSRKPKYSAAITTMLTLKFARTIIIAMNLKPSIYLQDMSLEKIIIFTIDIDVDVDKSGHATSQECMVR